MISILSFIIVIFGSINWLSIGMFQYDLVAGLFGYQGSIFSRLVYIVVGAAAIWLTIAIIKNKGKLNAKKLKHDERLLYDKHAKEEQLLRDIEKNENENIDVNNNSNEQPDNTLKRNHDNLSQTQNI